MDNKAKLLITAVVLAASFALGRYTKRADIKTETKIKEVIREKRIIVKGKDGTITETITKDTNTSIDSSTSVKNRGKIINISALALASGEHGNIKPEYGVSVNTEFIGPITIGLVGTTNGMIGLSLGLNF